MHFPQKSSDDRGARFGSRPAEYDLVPPGSGARGWACVRRERGDIIVARLDLIASRRAENDNSARADGGGTDGADVGLEDVGSPEPTGTEG
jgi:hypothetical protein